MSLAQGNNTPTRPRIEPGSPDPESDALTTRPVHPPVTLICLTNVCSLNQPRLEKPLAFTTRQQDKSCPKYVRFCLIKVKSMQRPGTEAIRTQIQPSNPKWKITNSQNTKRTYGQLSEQLFPKRWPLSNPKRAKINMNKHKVKRHRNSDTKNRQQRTTTEIPPWNGQ